RLDVALDVGGAPFLGMADIVDRYVVMLAPKERNVSKRLHLPEHIARGGLALAFGHDPVLDAEILSAVRIGPARDIAGRKDSRRAAFEIFIHRDAPIDFEAGALGQLGSRPHSDADDD